MCLYTNPSTHIAGQLRYLNRNSHAKVHIGVDLIVHLSNSGVAKESNAETQFERWYASPTPMALTYAVGEYITFAIRFTKEVLIDPV